jgi:membrane-bound ClpP family serine protease
MNETKQQWTMPGVILRVEGAAVLLAAILVYGYLDYSWWVFLLLLLWPDIAILVYALNPKAGGVAYNLLHTTIGPLLLLGASFAFSWPFATQFALIWFAHIGMDRMVGYGLKYPGNFKETHLQKI